VFLTFQSANLLPIREKDSSTQWL